MDEFQRTGYEVPIVDLIDNNASSTNDTNPQMELVDLIDDNNRYFNHHMPVIDLTDGKDQLTNGRVPIIDLTDDGVEDTTEQIQCIDLTDNASNNRRIEPADLTDQNNFDTGIPVVDLTNDNEELANSAILVVDRMDDDREDNTRQLQCISLTHDKQENINDHTSSVNLENECDQSFFKTVQSINLTGCSGYENIRQPVFYRSSKNTGDFIHNVESVEPINHYISTINLMREDAVLRRPVDDVETNDTGGMSSNKSSNSSQKYDSENIKVPAKNTDCVARQYKIKKYNKASNGNLIRLSPSRSVQQCQSRKETPRKKIPPKDNFEEKGLSPGKYEKYSENEISDFLKPASHPILFRHSLGRSTINTSKNVPIEISEGQSCTVSTTLRRKKLELNRGDSQDIQPSSSESSISRVNKLSFGGFKDAFLDFWIFVFHWILSMLRQILHTN